MITVFDAAGDGSDKACWALMRRAKSLSPQACPENLAASSDYVLQAKKPDMYWSAPRAAKRPVISVAEMAMSGGLKLANTNLRRLCSSYPIHPADMVGQPGQERIRQFTVTSDFSYIGIYVLCKGSIALLITPRLADPSEIGDVRTPKGRLASVPAGVSFHTSASVGMAQVLKSWLHS